MKILIKYFITVLLVFSCVGQASAALELITDDDTGEIVVFDTLSNRYWMYDMNLFGNMTYYQQVAGISQLNAAGYFGSMEWHMANRTQLDVLFSNIPSDLTIFVFTAQLDTQEITYGRIEESVVDTNHRMMVIYHIFENGQVGTDASAIRDGAADPVLGAWVTAVAPPPVSTPIPATVWLLGFGLLGLVGVNRKKRTKA